MEVDELDQDHDNDELSLVQRVVIENVRPEIQGGRFPIKRTIGEHVEVTADIYADGHDILRAVLLHRPVSRRDWEEVPMQPLVNDRWQAKFIVSAEGIHLYTLKAWLDPFQSWSRDFSKKFGQIKGICSCSQESATRHNSQSRTTALHFRTALGGTPISSLRLSRLSLLLHRISVEPQPLPGSRLERNRHRAVEVPRLPPVHHLEHTVPLEKSADSVVTGYHTTYPMPRTAVNDWMI